VNERVAHRYIWFKADEVSGMHPSDTRPFTMAQRVVALITERWLSGKRRPHLLHNELVMP